MSTLDSGHLVMIYDHKQTGPEQSHGMEDGFDSHCKVLDYPILLLHGRQKPRSTRVPAPPATSGATPGKLGFLSRTQSPHFKGDVKVHLTCQGDWARGFRTAGVTRPLGVS